MLRRSDPGPRPTTLSRVGLTAAVLGLVVLLVGTPAEAAPATIRKMHARSIGENSVHGSDAADTAQKEIGQFFSGNEIVG